MPSIVRDDALLYNEESRDDLNALARFFYAQHGYRVKEGFRFDLSQHPQERTMFSLACIASWYSREFGL